MINSSYGLNAQCSSVALLLRQTGRASGLDAVACEVVVHPYITRNPFSAKKLTVALKKFSETRR
jgi:hypothetical protein